MKNISITINEIDNGWLVMRSMYDPTTATYDYDYTPPPVKQMYVADLQSIGMIVQTMLSEYQTTLSE